jgi:hypothetical protein
MKNKVALIVHSCDRYALLFKGFDYFFKENWDLCIPCTCYFATEEIDIHYANFKNIKSGRGERTNRLVNLLDQIDEEYVLYFQEDMWLNKPVNKAFFIELFDLAIKNNWQQVKLNSSNVSKTEETQFFIEGFNVAKLINNESGYLMSHQVTLWRKDFLRNQLKPNEHPWRNERKGTKRLRQLNPEIYHVDYFAENGMPAHNHNKNPIGRSEYRSISENAALKDNVIPFLDVLKSAEGYTDYYEQLTFNYQNGLTHDGKAKPLKRNIFERLKTWFKKKLKNI